MVYLPPDASPLFADLTDPMAVATAAAELDSLDAVVHSAGICEGGTIAQTSRQTWSRQFELNVVAVADLTRLLLPLLRASHGQVVTINSGAGFHAGAGNGSYSAPKFALRSFTAALREGRLVERTKPRDCAGDVVEELGIDHRTTLVGQRWRERRPVAVRRA